MSPVPFCGQRTAMSRDEAIKHYILLRLRAEEINRLGYMVEGFYDGTIRLPDNAPFTCDDLKDMSRTAFFGWFATLTDKDPRVVYAFDPLFVLFPHRRAQIIQVQLQCESCHGVLQRFRSNVAFHSRADVDAQIEARQALRNDDTFLDLESARGDFQRLMKGLISEEIRVIPNLPQRVNELRVARHPAFANLAFVAPPAPSSATSAYLSCSILPEPIADLDDDGW